VLGISGDVQLDESVFRAFQVSEAVALRPQSHPRTKGSFAEQGMCYF